MKKYAIGAIGATLVGVGLKKAHDKGVEKGVKMCSLLLQTAIDTQQIVGEKYQKDTENEES